MVIGAVSDERCRVFGVASAPFRSAAGSAGVYVLTGLLRGQLEQETAGLTRTQMKRQLLDTLAAGLGDRLRVTAPADDRLCRAGDVGTYAWAVSPSGGTLTLTASNGAGNFTATGLPPWLTLSNGILSGVPTQAGIYQFTVSATNAAGTGSSVITLEVLATAGQLTRDLWTTGVGGSSLVNVPWTTAPTSSDNVTSAEDSTTSYGANTGERLRGYFTAPVTGNYYFWIAASNSAELWISNNSEPVNKVRRAFVTNSPPRTWDAQPNQKSQWLSLTAGKKYYIEALHNTGANGAGNHLSIAWFLDPTGNTANPITNGCAPATATVGGILPGHVLSPWDNPPTTTVPGSIYITNLQGVDGLSGITATGGARVGTTGSITFAGAGAGTSG
mgnify:CR=1 FL=1